MELTSENHLSLVGAFLDGELDPALARAFAAHLASCAECAQALEVQRAASRRLSALPLDSPSAGLRARVASVGLAQAPVERPRWGAARQALLGSGWLVAAALGAVLVLARRDPAGRGHPPMIEDALVDYRRTLAGALPASESRDALAALPFPVQPLRSPDAHLLGSWTTAIRGEPAAVLAYRWQDRVVLQYVVSEALFFHRPEVRDAVARQGLYRDLDGRDAVVAWPDARSGSVVIGEASADRLARLRL